MVPSGEDPRVVHTVAACRLTLDILGEDFSRDFPRLTEPLAMTLCHLLIQSLLRERRLARLLTDEQKLAYADDSHHEPDDELRAEARARLEAVMADAMLSELGHDA
jgi:hypothetical protein